LHQSLVRRKGNLGRKDRGGRKDVGRSTVGVLQITAIYGRRGRGQCRRETSRCKNTMDAGARSSDQNTGLCSEEALPLKRGTMAIALKRRVVGNSWLKLITLKGGGVRREKGSTSLSADSGQGNPTRKICKKALPIQGWR